MSQITKNKHRTTVFAKIWIFQISHCRRNWEHPVVPEYFRPVQDKCVCENLNFSNFILSQEMGTFCRSRIFEAGTGQMSLRKLWFFEFHIVTGHGDILSFHMLVRPVDTSRHVTLSSMSQMIETQHQCADVTLSPLSQIIESQDQLRGCHFVSHVTNN